MTTTLAPTLAHGTRTRYAKGCRCDDCRAANTEYSRRYHSRRNPPRTTRAPIAPAPLVQSGTVCGFCDRCDRLAYVQLGPGPGLCSVCAAAEALDVAQCLRRGLRA